jgi:hypothetical protein
MKIEMLIGYTLGAAAIASGVNVLIHYVRERLREGRMRRAQERLKEIVAQGRRSRMNGTARKSEDGGGWS